MPFAQPKPGFSGMENSRVTRVYKPSTCTKLKISKQANTMNPNYSLPSYTLTNLHAMYCTKLINGHRHY